MCSSNAAIVFTHLPYRMLEKESYNLYKRDALIERFLPYFKAYLRCKRIKLVFFYVDTGIALVLMHLYEQIKGSDSALKFSISELDFEQNTRNCLKLAVDKAVNELIGETGGKFNPEEAPKFQFIGLPHLSGLIRTLYEANPALLKELAGEKGNFGYDSPKFIEAVIRISFRDLYPVLRFDADVEVNDEGVNAILDKVRTYPNYDFAFFSGGYGTYSKPLDPVNDYAVRLHWLVDRNLYNDGLYKNDPVKKLNSLSEHNKSFLGDLTELGATQVVYHHDSQQPVRHNVSQAMEEFINNSRNGIYSRRRAKQVISGAGLYMNFRTIQKLPPFMSFDHLTLWVDDAIKRRLHEVLGDLTDRQLEHIDEARFVQNRHPDGIKEIVGKEEKDVKNYFDKMLRGCILYALVVKHNNEIGVLSKIIQDVLPPNEKRYNKNDLRKSLTDEAKNTAETVLCIWKKADYGNERLAEWSSDINNLDEIVEGVVNDALAYVRLVIHWDKFIAAINNLGNYQAYWLLRDMNTIDKSRVL